MLHQCHFATLYAFIHTHKRNELHLPFLKSKSLYFSALIARKPAQWALLRLQRYI